MPRTNSNMTIQGYIASSNIIIKDLERMVISARKEGLAIEGMVINTPQMSLNEAEIRYEVAKELKLLMLGGSNDWNLFGLFGMGVSKTNRVLNALRY